MSLNVESLAGDRMGGPPLVTEKVSGQRMIPEGGALAFEQRSVAEVQSSTLRWHAVVSCGTRGV